MITVDRQQDSTSWGETQVDLRISVDPVLFTLLDGKLQVHLRRRTWNPFRGMWALPGVINPAGEQIEETMWRELQGLGFTNEVWVEQLKTFDRPAQSIGGITVPGRDPRGRVISVAYFAMMPSAAARRQSQRYESIRENHGISGQDHSRLAALGDETAWFPLENLPDLAFDHAEIVDYALWRLRNKIQYAPVAFELLSLQFTLTELQEVYEAVLGTTLDKRNFRRKVLAEKVVTPTEEFSRREKRPARLYRFNDRHFSYSPRALRSSNSFDPRIDSRDPVSV